MDKQTAHGNDDKTDAPEEKMHQAKAPRIQHTKKLGKRVAGNTTKDNPTKSETRNNTKNTTSTPRRKHNKHPHEKIQQQKQNTRKTIHHTYKK